MSNFTLDSPYTSGEQDFWMPRLGLFFKDKAILESKDQWLTDSIIHAAQQMIKAQTDDIAGLQSPQCGRSATFDPISHQMKYLQIMHTSGNHWIVVSNIMLDQGGSSSMSMDSVFVYDSLRSTRISKILKKHVCQTLTPKAKRLTFSVMNVMAQPNDYDCGLFAVAIATALANNTDPCCCTWDVKQMRLHLLSSFQVGSLSQFPHKRRRVPLGGKVLKSIPENIYCACRMPYDKDIDMILCNHCLDWFHGNCVGVKINSYPKEEQWVCNDCIKFVKKMAT